MNTSAFSNKSMRMGGSCENSNLFHLIVIEYLIYKLHKSLV